MRCYNEQSGAHHSRLLKPPFLFSPVTDRCRHHHGGASFDFGGCPGPPCSRHRLRSGGVAACQRDFKRLRRAISGMVTLPPAGNLNNTADDFVAEEISVTGPFKGILHKVSPRFIPYEPRQAATCVIYTDAYFLEGGIRYKAGHVPANAAMSPRNKATNGWGYVLLIGHDVLYDLGFRDWFVRNSTPGGRASTCSKWLPRS